VKNLFKKFHKNDIFLCGAQGANTEQEFIKEDFLKHGSQRK